MLGPSLPHSQLEVQLQCQLDLARITRTARVGAKDRRERARNLAEGTGSVDIRIRVSKVGMVEGIEKLCPDLQLPPLCELELFEQAEIGVRDSWAVEQPRGACAERTHSRI